jgi:hypothetical protein
MTAPTRLAIVALLLAPVAAAAADPQALAGRIDARLAARFEEERAVPAPPCDDATFLRRVFLDLTGRIPASRDVYEFLADPAPDKRRLLLERLLDGPRHAAHEARVWRGLLLPEAATNAEARVFQPGLEAWLRPRFRDNLPYDRLVRELLTVPISADPQAPEAVLRRPEDPNPLAFFAVKEGRPENLAAATTRLFLGQRLECAQCHDHPFARWTRRQFWQQAAFFAGLERQGRNLFAPLSEAPDRRELKQPGSETLVTAVFLDGKVPDWKDGAPRAVLAAWVTARDNPYFARAAVNRLWGRLMGRGLVDPVDDFHDDNPPSHPELLGDLARAFVASDFDLRFLTEAICLSRAYQRGSARTHPSQDDPRLFARRAVKGLGGEELFDSLALATGFHEDGRGLVRAQFLNRFAAFGEAGEPETSIAQALMLMNGRLVAAATDLESSVTLRAIVGLPGLDDPGRVEALYVATLSRKPTAPERERALVYLARGGADRRGERLADLFWVLLNSAEFRLNH